MKNSYFRQKSRSGNDDCDVNLRKLKCPHKPPSASLYAMPYNGNTAYTIYKQMRYKIFLRYIAYLQIGHNSANRKRPAKYRNEAYDRYGQWRTRYRGENEASSIKANRTRMSVFFLSHCLFFVTALRRIYFSVFRFRVEKRIRLGNDAAFWIWRANYDPHRP